MNSILHEWIINNGSEYTAYTPPCQDAHCEPVADLSPELERGRVDDVIGGSTTTNSVRLTATWRPARHTNLVTFSFNIIKYNTVSVNCAARSVGDLEDRRTFRACCCLEYATHCSNFAFLTAPPPRRWPAELAAPILVLLTITTGPTCHSSAVNVHHSSVRWDVVVQLFQGQLLS
jgi:hypothetical protein